MEKETFLQSFSNQISKERGSTMVEYALMVVMVAAGCVVSVQSVGNAADAGFLKVKAAMASGGEGGGGGPPPPP